MKQQIRIQTVWNTEWIQNLAEKNRMSDTERQWLERFGSAFLRDIPLRALILELQQMKADGMLKGDSAQEEYQYYIQQYLQDKGYQECFLEKYPEMERLSMSVVNDALQLIREIFSRLERDKEEIIKSFCNGKRFEDVADINFSMADSHNHGKRVAKLTLDNGVILYYKPRTLRKNQIYHQAYQYICNEMGLSCQKIQCLDRGEYGWEEEAVYRECETEEEVKRYFIIELTRIPLPQGYAL